MRDVRKEDRDVVTAMKTLTKMITRAGILQLVLLRSRIDLTRMMMCMIVVRETRSHEGREPCTIICCTRDALVQVKRNTSRAIV